MIDLEREGMAYLLGVVFVLTVLAGLLILVLS